MLEMKDDIRTEWVAALRSGEYEQGKSFLRVNNRFCCLGVLCELAVNAGVIGQGVLIDFEDGTFGYGDGEEYSTLPEEVKEWAGIENDEAKLTKYEDRYEPGLSHAQANYLTSLNDGGWSFEQIADLIEKTED